MPKPPRNLVCRVCGVEFTHDKQGRPTGCIKCRGAYGTAQCAVPGCDRWFTKNSGNHRNCPEHERWHTRTVLKAPDPIAPTCDVCDQPFLKTHHSQRYCEDHNPISLSVPELRDLFREYPHARVWHRQTYGRLVLFGV